MTKHVLQKLRSDIRRLDHTALSGRAEADVMSLGVPAVDRSLPWGGLPRGALHEIGTPPKAAPSFFASAAGFAAALLARSVAPSGMAIWCQNRRRARRYGQIYGPGLAPYGLDPNRLLMVNAESDADVLWVMEEGLRSSAIQAVLGEVAGLDLTASRRLQLAAEKSGSPAFLLRVPEGAAGNNAALTRWHVRPFILPQEVDKTGAEQVTGWQVALWRCRGGGPAEWKVMWKDEAFYCHMAGAMADRLPAAAVC